MIGAAISPAQGFSIAAPSRAGQATKASSPSWIPRPRCGVARPDEPWLVSKASGAWRGSRARSWSRAVLVFDGPAPDAVAFEW